MSPFHASYLWLIPLLPFAGFLINGTLGRRLPRSVVSAVALLFTAVPAGLVAWLWATMRSARLYPGRERPVDRNNRLPC